MLLVAPNAFVVHHNHPKATWGLKADLVRVYKNWYGFVYDKDKNLIGMATLGSPVLKKEDEDLTFKLKMDF